MLQCELIEVLLNAAFEWAVEDVKPMPDLLLEAIIDADRDPDWSLPDELLGIQVAIGQVGEDARAYDLNAFANEHKEFRLPNGDAPSRFWNSLRLLVVRFAAAFGWTEELMLMRDVFTRREAIGRDAA